MRKMRLKNNNKKSNKLRVIKILFLITIIYISFSYSFYYSLRRNKDINNSNFIKSLVRMGNSNNLYNNKLIKVVNSTINFITHVDVTKPSSIITSYVSKINNYDSINYFNNLGIKNIVVNNDLTKEELVQIKDNTNSNLFYFQQSVPLQGHNVQQ